MLSFNQNCGLSLASENWFMLLGSKISVFHLIPLNSSRVSPLCSPIIVFLFLIWFYCLGRWQILQLVVLMRLGTKSALEEQEWIWKQVYDLHKLIDPDPFGS